MPEFDCVFVRSKTSEIVCMNRGMVWTKMFYDLIHETVTAAPANCSELAKSQIWSNWANIKCQLRSSAVLSSLGLQNYWVFTVLTQMNPDGEECLTFRETKLPHPFIFSFCLLIKQKHTSFPGQQSAARRNSLPAMGIRAPNELVRTSRPYSLDHRRWSSTVETMRLRLLYSF